MNNQRNFPKYITQLKTQNIVLNAYHYVYSANSIHLYYEDIGLFGIQGSSPSKNVNDL